MGQKQMNTTDKLVLLPIQIIQQENGVILKRGVEQFLIPDPNALLVIRVIQKALLQEARSRDELLELFAAPAHPLISALLDHLLKKRFVIIQNDEAMPQPSGQESAQDIFYWHFNQHQEHIAVVLNEKRWLFVGLNRLNEQLLQAMLDEGLENYEIVDDPMLRDIACFDDRHRLRPGFWRERAGRIVAEDNLLAATPGALADYGFVVAASEFGSNFLLERWNEFAVTHGLAFYPALLQNMVGYAGPLVVPQETACLACLTARQNSHSPRFEERRLAERHAFAGQRVAAYHEAMLKTLAAVAAFDLVKFKSNIQWEVGTLCEIDMLAGSMTRRKLLKAPRCRVCSGLRERPLVNLHQQLTSAAAWDEIRETVGHHED